MGDRDRNRFRWAWWLLAYASLGVGIVGIFVPGLPTTVFVIVAAWAATRGSRRLERRLLAHPHFGPVILACAAILLLVMATVPSHSAWMAVLPIACMAVVGTWLWLRPEPTPREPGP